MSEDTGEDWVQYDKGPEVITIDEVEIEKPKLFKVIFLNDDFTPIEWVRSALIQLFRKTEAEAKLIALQVHNTGKGIAGVYTLDIADTRSKTVNYAAEKEGHPFKSEIEAE